MLHEYDPGDPTQPGGYVENGTKTLMIGKKDIAGNDVGPFDFQANPDRPSEPWTFEFLNAGTPETAHCTDWTDYGWGWAIGFAEDHSIAGRFSFYSPSAGSHLFVGDKAVHGVYIGPVPARAAYVGETKVLG